MKEFYEGQVYELSPISYDLVQFKGEKILNFKKAKFLVIPQFDGSDKENFLIINYFKDVEVLENGGENCGLDETSISEANKPNEDKFCSNKNHSEERQGILKYLELRKFPIFKTILVHSEVILVKKPLVFREFAENGSKFLKILEFTDQKYSLMMESGIIIRHGDAFKVYGSGCYIFKTSNIVYRFGQNN